MGARRLRRKGTDNPRRAPVRPSSVLGWALAVGVACVTFFAFLPALSADFVNWDDDTLIVNNPDFRGFGPSRIRWMFTTTLQGNYQRMTWLSFAFDAVGGDIATAHFHLTNIILHALGAALFYFLARRLLRAAAADAPDPYV